MTIRDAVTADLPGILAIYNEAIPRRIATADLGSALSDRTCRDDGGKGRDAARDGR